MSFKLILVSSPQAIPSEAEWITRLFRAGLKKLHLRKPGYPGGEMRSLIRAVPARYYPRIVIHSHYTLAKEFSLGGIHLTEKGRRAGRVRRMKQKTFSASFHQMDELMRSRKEYDYVFLGPVFDSISKQGYKSIFGRSELKKNITEFKCKKKKTELVAIGGISEKNILLVKELGFDGAAVLGAVWQSKDPCKAFVRMQSRFR